MSEDDASGPTAEDSPETLVAAGWEVFSARSLQDLSPDQQARARRLFLGDTTALDGLCDCGQERLVDGAASARALARFLGAAMEAEQRLRQSGVFEEVGVSVEHEVLKEMAGLFTSSAGFSPRQFRKGIEEAIFDDGEMPLGTRWPSQETHPSVVSVAKHLRRAVQELRKLRLTPAVLKDREEAFRRATQQLLEAAVASDADLPGTIKQVFSTRAYELLRQLMPDLEADEARNLAIRIGEVFGTENSQDGVDVVDARDRRIQRIKKRVQRAKKK